ncbi:uncharacterized protein LOC124451272 [Xenia sp. Carnegie-2017]|uniref:uncharacterized protein LOC124451272 n=1 Tax=Xenia sp. Carnegie-2017 TaxID=2897299 RepID=UPI001F040701|nr:uncharacterized protein LOC124451272 [Xenia sp. Carnegie-2017]
MEDEMLNTLQWTEDSYSLQNFVNVFSLPQVVKVIRGYDGGEHSATIGHGVVLTLHAIRESRLLQDEDNEIESSLKRSPYLTVIATTVNSDVLLKFCLAIPKDIDIEIVVADGFDNGAKHYTNIVNKLNDRFDVVKFMNAYESLLIRRQDHIQKFDYDAIKEYIIDKSILLSKCDDEEELDVVDMPTLPPQRVENPLEAKKGNHIQNEFSKKSPGSLLSGGESLINRGSTSKGNSKSNKFFYIPQDPSVLSVIALADLLRNLNMGQYAEIFEEKQIDGRMLMEITDSDLKSFNMSAFHQSKLMSFIKGWRPKLKSRVRGEMHNPVMSSNYTEVFSFEHVESSDAKEMTFDRRPEKKDKTMDKYVSCEVDPSCSSFPFHSAIIKDENIEEKPVIDESISTPKPDEGDEGLDEVDGPGLRRVKQSFRQKVKSFDLTPTIYAMDISEKSVLGRKNNIKSVAGSQIDGNYRQKTSEDILEPSNDMNPQLVNGVTGKDNSKESIHEDPSNTLPATTVYHTASPTINEDNKNVAKEDEVIYEDLSHFNPSTAVFPKSSPVIKRDYKNTEKEAEDIYEDLSNIIPSTTVHHIKPPRISQHFKDTTEEAEVFYENLSNFHPSTTVYHTSSPMVNNNCKNPAKSSEIFYENLSNFQIDRNAAFSAEDSESSLKNTEENALVTKNVDKGNDNEAPELPEKSPELKMRINAEIQALSSEPIYQRPRSLLSTINFTSVAHNRPNSGHPYELICNIPLDLSGLSVGEVADILRNLNMGRYANIFEDELIDGRLLNELTDADLKSFNMSSLHCTKLMNFIKGWRPELVSRVRDKTYTPVTPSNNKEVLSFENVKSSNEKEISDNKRSEEKDTTMDEFESCGKDPSYSATFPTNPAIRSDENIEEKSVINESISSPKSDNEEVFDEVDGFQRKLKNTFHKTTKSFDLQPSFDTDISKKDPPVSPIVLRVTPNRLIEESPQKSISNVPFELSDIDVIAVADILRNLNMGEYADIFAKELIDGRLLMKLTESDLESFNMTAFHRSKLMKFIKAWSPVLVIRSTSLYEREAELKNKFLDEDYNIRKEIEEKFKSLSWICDDNGTVGKYRVTPYPHLCITVDGDEGRPDEDLKKEIDEIFELEASKFIEFRRLPLA